MKEKEEIKVVDHKRTTEIKNVDILKSSMGYPFTVGDNETKVEDKKEQK